MKILVDADACPRAAKEILFRAAERTKIPMTLIANQYIRVPQSDHIDSIAVAAGTDEADDHIVELAEADDLVITADIPLVAAAHIPRAGSETNCRMVRSARWEESILTIFPGGPTEGSKGFRGAMPVSYWPDATRS